MSRRDRLKQRDEARNRVMARLAAGPQQQQTASRRIDRMKDPAQDRLPAVNSVGMMREGLQNPAALTPPPGRASVGASIATPPPGPSAIMQPQQPEIASSIRNWRAQQPEIVPEPPKPVQGKGLTNSLAGQIASVIDAASFGLSEPLTNKFRGYIDDNFGATHLDREGQKTAETIAGVAGSLGAGTGAYRAASGLLKPLTKRAPQGVDNLVKPLVTRMSPQTAAATRLSAQSLGRGAEMGAKGALTGALYQAPIEATEALYRKNDQTIGQRVGDIAKMAALGAVLDPAAEKVLGAGAELIGRGVQRARDNRDLNREIKDFIGRTKAPDTNVAPPPAPPRNVVTAPPVPDMAKPNARQDWFTDLFGQQGVGATAGAKQGKEMIDTHVVGNRREQGPLSQRAGEAVSSIEQDFIDKFAPFRKIDEKTYNAAMDSTRANNLANIAIKDKMVDLEGNVIGKSLKDVYANVPRGKKNIADRYSILRDSVSRMDRGIRVFGDQPWFPKTAEEAAAMADKLLDRNPWLKQYAEDMNSFIRNRQNLWVQSGIASEQLVNTLRHTNPNYIPMQRQQPRGNLASKFAGNAGGDSFSGQKAPVKRATGSSRKIVDPAQNLIETTGTSYNAMMRNRAMSSLYDAVMANPDKYRGIIEVVEESSEMRKLTMDQINNALKEDGLEGVVGMLNGELDNIFKKTSQVSGKNDAVVTVMRQGQPVKMRVMEPSLLKAIDGISPEVLDSISSVANTISRGIKQSATGVLAPVQGAKLALRDMPVAFAQSKAKRKFLGDISHAFISQAADWLPKFIPGTEKMAGLARQYYRAGGGYEAYLKGDSTIRAVSSDITRDPILSGRNALKTVRKTGLGLRPLKEFGDALENIPRIAAFKAEMRKNGWSRDPDSVRAAIDAGREATVNWSRRGSKGAAMEAWLPYSNAAVQGTYRVAKRFKEQPISATALIMGAAASKIAAYERFKDDPDYQQRSKYEKGIPIAKTASGKFVVQPIEPTEGAIADQILDFYKWAKYGEEGPGFKESAQELADAFLPKYAAGPIESLTTPGVGFAPKEGVNSLVSGSTFEPFQAMASGQNFFGGDIVPREYQDLPTSMQYNETTSAPAKWAAENLNIDAFTFDYLGQKFGGDIAKIGLPMTSEVGRGDPAGNIWDETLTRLKLLEDPVMKNNISNDYYTLATSVSQAKAANSRKDVELPDWYQQAYDEVTSQKKGSVASRVSELNTQKKEIQRNPNLTAKMRADRLRDVQSEINLLRIEGIKRMKELGVPEAPGR